MSLCSEAFPVAVKLAHDMNITNIDNLLRKEQGNRTKNLPFPVAVKLAHGTNITNIDNRYLEKNKETEQKNFF